MAKIRHLPYYIERTLEEDESYTERIKDDPVQGLGVAGRSGFIEVYDAQNNRAYAKIILYDNNTKSEPIPLYFGESVLYEYLDNIRVERIKITAKNGWITYRMHWVPGLQPEEEFRVHWISEQSKIDDKEGDEK